MAENKTRVPFPRYLNAKKLFYKWEYDVVFAAVISFTLLFGVQILFSVALLVAFGVSLVVAYFVMLKYVKFFKKTRKGYITHLAYSKGYKEPIDVTKIEHKYEEHLIPRGFENSFID